MRIELSPRETEAFLRYYGGYGNQDFQKARLAMIGEAIDHLDWEKSENYRSAQLALTRFRQENPWFSREEESGDYNQRANVEGFDVYLPVEKKAELYWAQYHREVESLHAHEDWEMDRD